MQWSKLEIETEKQAAGIEGAPAANCLDALPHLLSTFHFPLLTFNF